MKKIMVAVLLGVLAVSFPVNVFASDWDKAGKALTIIEGLRLVTGGRVDVVGTITGIGKQAKHHRLQGRDYDHYQYRQCRNKYWVPHYVWKRKYIPRRKGYDEKYGKVIVEGHYIKYKVERGGHWETSDYCG